MRLRSEVKVGLIVFAGIAALIAVYWYLGGLGLRASTYPIYAVFGNAQKLERGALIRMAGVKIGLVSDSTLTKDTKARVDMWIDKGIAIPADSVARITTGSFIGEYYVDIQAGRSKRYLRSGQRIRSLSTTTPDELIEGANEVLRTLQGSVEGINALVGGEKLPRMIEETVAALNKAAESAADLVSSTSQLVERLSPEVEATVANAERASRSAADAGAELDDMLHHDVRPRVSSLLAGANKLMEDIDKSVGEARELIEGYKGGGPGLEKLMTQAEKTLHTIDGAAVQAQEMLTNLNEASSSIKELATDEQIKKDLKKTIHNVSEVSGQLKETIDTIGKRFGPAAAPTAEQKRKVPEYGLTANALANTGKGQSRFDAYYTFLQGKEFYRVGGYNIGENTQLIAQGGSTFGAGGAFRYGIYASRVGFGYDQRFGQTGLFSLDLFRPNDPELDMRVTARVGDWLGVYLGTDDLLHSENQDLLIGLQYRR